MVRMTAKNSDRPVKLLARHDPDELMRPRHRAQGDDAVRLFANRSVEPLGPPDHDCVNGPRRVAGPAEVVRRGQGKNRRRLLKTPLLGAAGARLADFVEIRARDARRPGALFEAVEISFKQLPLRTGFQPADANEHKAHGALYARASPGRSALHIFSRL